MDRGGVDGFKSVGLDSARNVGGRKLKRLKTLFVV